MLYAFVDEFKTIRRLNLKVAYLNNLFNVIICCYKFFKVSLSFLKKLQTKMGANENHNYSLTYLYLQFQVALMCIYIQPNPVLLRLERQVKLNAVPLQKNTSFSGVKKYLYQRSCPSNCLSVRRVLNAPSFRAPYDEYPAILVW